MYLQHFQMTEKPFSLTPDTQFFVNYRSHREALNTLFFALRDGEGFIKIVGEVGTGKTLLCRILLSKLDKSRFVTAYIPNPCLAPEELKAFIATEIGAEYQRSMPSHELTSAIYRRLIQIARQKKRVVLVVDEAQTMPRETIEALRLLTNLETEKHKLLQVVILGQPELDVLLHREDLRQLKQRIVFAEKLQPLDYAGVVAYVQHRLKASGCAQNNLFSPLAVWLLAKASGGIPRLINILAHKALLCAYGRGDISIAGWHIAMAVRDTPEARLGGRFWCRLWQLNGRAFVPRAAGVAR
ncbi:AAA family ATPase [Saccharophagus sp. K07]|uniref:ExeA family protein n=1 Tax=Saccharophagus sp. K07 TaxID=2283636 RepID=UPI0016526654|nr:AAA family ATPase [Saccharophagus sp. K07]MBC6906862.1 AAA family ATPase [Saccharophagus sp. K07]